MIYTPSQVHDKFIFVYDNVLPKPICIEIIEKFENSEHKFSGVMASGLSDRKKSTELYINPKESLWKNIDDSLYNTIL